MPLPAFVSVHRCHFQRGSVLQLRELVRAVKRSLCGATCWRDIVATITRARVGAFATFPLHALDVRREKDFAGLVHPSSPDHIVAGLVKPRADRTATTARRLECLALRCSNDHCVPTLYGAN